ncbi:MAG TPA: hypothetical protein VFP53_05515 [Sphingomicrobium sp.]|nr:hypothetical protein [Sphingomicrobium sp.]
MDRLICMAMLLAAGCTRAEEPQPVNEAAATTTDAAESGTAAAEPEVAANEKGQPPPSAVSPCLLQDGKPVDANAIRAIGTEPFWGAKVEGRCVTYSTPEDQDGTRVWTKFSGTTESGRWEGALGRAPFVMTTRPQAGCSDGMSDNVYPIAVTLTVGGEERRGCAEPR